MADYNSDNFTHVYLRRIDEKLDRVLDDVSDLKIKASAIERNFGEVQVQIAGLNSRVDRVETRLVRIEKRLDLREDAFMELASEPFKGPTE